MLVKSSDGRADIIFYLVNIVSSQNVVHLTKCDDPSFSNHVRGSKLQDDMIQFRSPTGRGSTVLHFPSTGATNVTVRDNFDLRMQASYNYLLHSHLTWNKEGSMAMSYSTNNLNHSGQLYGIISSGNITQDAVKFDTHVADKNDNFPSLKFTIPFGESFRRYQLFVPSFNVNTQYQTLESLLVTGQKFLDIVLKYVDFSSEWCQTCVQLEWKLCRKLDFSEVMALK